MLEYAYDVSVVSDSRLEVMAVAKQERETLARVFLSLRWFDDELVGDRDGGSIYRIAFEVAGAWDSFTEDQARLARAIGGRLTISVKDRDDIDGIRDAVETYLLQFPMPQTLAQWQGRG
ncbi:hypothetical protein [Microvirga mediterraneensis]|uniref:Uncharacterized protein n=1 Tax=Microvirga mediterraneensis TaxID=2754695 RepID=A0A838BUU2_9HYPH|nr:hypothetical protein [Microvirga mediterraneensis]MBA1159020.1 hypothetical protein [Microvirga mediterraneensis]